MARQSRPVPDSKHGASPLPSRKARVQQGDPRACWDESQTGSDKPAEQQQRDSKLEAGRPKDTGGCG